MPRRWHENGRVFVQNLSERHRPFPINDERLLPRTFEDDAVDSRHEAAEVRETGQGGRSCCLFLRVHGATTHHSLQRIGC